VARARVTGAGFGLLAWTQVISDLGDPDHFADRLLAGAGALDLDQVARWLASGSERLIVIDDIDRAGPAAIELLSVIGSRLASGPAAVVATTGVPLALAPELRLAGLTEAELAELLGGLPDRGRACVVAGLGRAPRSGPWPNSGE